MPGKGTLPSSYEYKPLPFEVGLQVRQGLQNQFNQTRDAMQTSQLQSIAEIPNSVLDPQARENIVAGLEKDYSDIASGLMDQRDINKTKDAILKTRQKLVSDPGIMAYKNYAALDEERIKYSANNPTGFDPYKYMSYEELQAKGITPAMVLENRAPNYNLQEEVTNIYKGLPQINKMIQEGKHSIEIISNAISSREEAEAANHRFGTEEFTAAHDALRKIADQNVESGTTGMGKYFNLRGTYEGNSMQDIKDAYFKELVSAAPFIERARLQAQAIKNKETKKKEAKKIEGNTGIDGVTIHSDIAPFKIGYNSTRKDLEQRIKDAPDTFMKNQYIGQLEAYDNAIENLGNTFLQGESTENIEDLVTFIKEKGIDAIDDFANTYSTDETSRDQYGNLTVNISYDENKQKIAEIVKANKEAIGAHLNDTLISQTDYYLTFSKDGNTHLKTIGTHLAHEELTGVSITDSTSGKRSDVKVLPEDVSAITSILQKEKPEGVKVSFRQGPEGMETILHVDNSEIAKLFPEGIDEENALYDVVSNALDKNNSAGTSEFRFKLQQDGLKRYLGPELRAQLDVTQFATLPIGQEKIDAPNVTNQISTGLSYMNSRMGRSLRISPTMENSVIQIDSEPYRAKDLFTGFERSIPGNVVYKDNTAVTTGEAVDRMLDKTNFTGLMNIAQNVSESFTEDQRKQLLSLKSSFENSTVPAQRNRIADQMKDMVKNAMTDSDRNKPFRFRNSNEVLVYSSNYFEKDTYDVSEDNYVMDGLDLGELRSLIMEGEADSRGYDSFNTTVEGYTLEKSPTEMTVSEAMSTPGAKGLYQFVNSKKAPVLDEMKAAGIFDEMGISLNDTFNKEVQDKLFLGMLKHIGLDEFIRNQDIEAFQDILAGRWAGLENSTGVGTWDGYKGNKASVDSARIQAALQRLLGQKY